MDTFWNDYSKFLKSEQWSLVKQRAFRYYGKRCRCCLSYKMVQLHHLSYKNYRNPAMADVIPLCKFCHDNLTAYGRKNRIRGTRLLDAHKATCKARKRTMGQRPTR